MKDFFETISKSKYSFIIKYSFIFLLISVLEILYVEFFSYEPYLLGFEMIFVTVIMLFSIAKSYAKIKINSKLDYLMIIILSTWFISGILCLSIDVDITPVGKNYIADHLFMGLIKITDIYKPIDTNLEIYQLGNNQYIFIPNFIVSAIILIIALFKLLSKKDSLVIVNKLYYRKHLYLFFSLILLINSIGLNLSFNLDNIYLFIGTFVSSFMLLIIYLIFILFKKSYDDLMAIIILSIPYMLIILRLIMMYFIYGFPEKIYLYNGLSLITLNLRFSNDSVRMYDFSIMNIYYLFLLFGYLYFYILRKKNNKFYLLSLE